MLAKLFPTFVYRDKVASSGVVGLNRELLKEAKQIRAMDKDGLVWSRGNYPGGYTSYGSLSELHQMSSTFLQLKQQLDKHVRRFAQQLDIDQRQAKLEMVSCWVNIMPAGAAHSLHLHPLSCISGTYYVQTPKGSSPLKFEDPRLSKFMGSAPRLDSARADNQRFCQLEAKAGDVLLWESWLRHEVAHNRSKGERVSISFNYNWF